MKNRSRRRLGRLITLTTLCLALAAAVVVGCNVTSTVREEEPIGAAGQAIGNAGATVQNGLLMIQEGRQTFRFDTFGDEAFWGDKLKLHLAIAGSANGGVGPGLSPSQALGLGLKVDVEALPQALRKAIKSGQVNLGDPAVTVALLKLNAVVGLTGFFRPNGQLKSIGIQCALCHSTVDDSFAEGIGHRLDGWANRDLNVGEIIALAPDLSFYANLLGLPETTVRAVFRSWGPGKFDAELILDGKAVNPFTNQPGATLIPPAYGLPGVNLHTWTGWGSVTHWNAFVAVLEMQGSGTLFDPRLDDASKFPIAAANGFGHVRRTPDRVTPKLAALHFFQLAIPAPTPPPCSFDEDAAERGKELFEGKAKCSNCHVPPLFTDPGWNMHTPEEICVDPFQAQRSPDEHYRTSPLKGLFAHQKGGFYHDGRFDTLDAVIEHYDACFGLGLDDDERDDLVEYLISL